MTVISRDMYLLAKSENFHLDSGQEASVNLKLVRVKPLPCTQVCGQVVGDCVAIPGATVKVLGMDSKPVCHTETDQNGLFSFINTLVPGNYVIIVSAENYMISESRFICLQPFVPLYAIITLNTDKDAENAAVYGTVRNGENVPLPNALIRIFGNEDSKCEAKSAISNADGEYLFTGLKPGKYAITALCSGYTLPEDITVEVLPKDIFCADLYLYRNIVETKGTISGVVLHSGCVVPYAVAVLYRKESNGYSPVQIQQTNSDGAYLFSNLTSGEYLVKAKL